MVEMQKGCSGHSLYPVTLVMGKIGVCLDCEDVCEDRGRDLPSAIFGRMYELSTDDAEIVGNFMGCTAYMLGLVFRHFCCGVQQMCDFYIVVCSMIISKILLIFGMQLYIGIRWGTNLTGCNDGHWCR